MKPYIPSTILAVVLAALSLQVWAEGAEPEGLQLAPAPINRSDMDSIKRGAAFFVNNCSRCHTLKYLTYDKVALEAGITADKTPANIELFGVKPPDLSLEADVRGVNWIYTYLHSFYPDPSRPTGANNLLVPNTAMMNVMAPYQGTQELVQDPKRDLWHEVQWYDVLKLTDQGSMTPEQFDAATADLVNFLAYAAQPFHIEQERIGKWVLGFLAFLFVLMYMLKNEYWKDVKKHK